MLCTMNVSDSFIFDAAYMAALFCFVFIQHCDADVTSQPAQTPPNFEII